MQGLEILKSKKAKHLSQENRKSTTDRIPENLKG